MNMRRVFLVLLFLAVLAASAGVAGATPAGYQYSVQHNIVGSPDGLQSSYVMKLVIYNNSGSSGGANLYVDATCQPDFDDIWINDSSDLVRLPHWISWEESGSNYVVVYYNLTQGVPSSGTNINIYYGNSAATNSENPSGVFSWFTDFDTASMTVTGGSISGGKLTLSGTASYAYTSQTFGAGYATIGYGYITKGSNPGGSGMYEYAMVGFGDSAMNNVASLGSGHVWNSGVYGVVTSKNGGTGGDAYFTAYSGNRLWEVHRTASFNDFFIDGTSVYSTSSYFTSASIPAMAYIHDQYSTDTVVLYWYAVKRCTANEPYDGSWSDVNNGIYQRVKFTLTSYIVSYPDVAVSVLNVDQQQVMTGTTGSDGGVAFQMYSTQYYTVHFLNISQGIDYTWSGYPADTSYTFFIMPPDIARFMGINTTGTLSNVMDTTRYITAKTYGEQDGSTGYLSVMYNDSLQSTSSIEMTVYLVNKSSNAYTYVDSNTQAANNATHTFTIANAANNSYVVVVNGTTTQGLVQRYGTHTFQQNLYYDMGWPHYLYSMFALAIGLIIAYIGTRRSMMAAGAMFIGSQWFFWLIGWTSDWGGAIPVLIGVGTCILIGQALAQWRQDNGVYGAGGSNIAVRIALMAFIFSITVSFLTNFAIINPITTQQLASSGDDRAWVTMSGDLDIMSGGISVIDLLTGFALKAVGFIWGSIYVKGILDAFAMNAYPYTAATLVLQISIWAAVFIGVVGLISNRQTTGG